jgi:hypothetical protein
MDRGVDACVASDNLLDAAPIAPEPIYERRVGMEQPTECIHVVPVPRLLETRSDFSKIRNLPSFRAEPAGSAKIQSKIFPNLHLPI